MDDNSFDSADGRLLYCYSEPKPSLHVRVDAHQHFWRYDRVRDSWITDEMRVLQRDYLPGDLLPELEAAGVQASIAVQTAQSEDETRFLLELAERHAFIAGVVGWVDLCDPRVTERLEYFSRFEKLRGFRHIAQSEADDRFLCGDAFVRGVSLLRQFGLTYDILIFPKQLPAALELVEKCPEQRFVLDHLAKPSVRTGELDSWRSYMRAMARHDNTFCKLSGLVTEADWRLWRASDFKPYLDVVFENFGVDRLMFGSDWPVCLLAATYRQVVDLIDDYLKHRPASDREKIFGGNAVRFYDVKVLAHGFTS